MADSITIVALKPLRTLTPSGVRVREAHSGDTSGCDTSHLALKQHGPDPRSRTHQEVPPACQICSYCASDLGGSYCPRYDFSHFNRPWTRICQGAPVIVILLPIAKITSQVSQSRSARIATDTAPSIWKVLGRVTRVLCLSSSRCTLKRVLQGMRAQWTLTHSNGRAVIMRCCLDMKIFDERGAQNEQSGFQKGSCTGVALHNHNY
jgi:hypothetical protein